MSNTEKTEKNETTTAVKSEKDCFVELLSAIQLIKQQLTSLAKTVKETEKKVNKKIKGLEKECKKSKNKGNKQPSGFAHPSLVSNELCEFMDKPHDTKMARTDVTKYIIQYIKSKKLEDPSNAKIIKPDKDLASLFNIKDATEQLTYFNMQRHMNKHFLKSN